MRACPHCQKKTISNWSKLWSITVTPVQCSACQQFSFLHAGHALKGLAFWIVVTWIFIGLAWVANSSFLLTGTIPALFLAINHFILGAPMRPIILNKE